MLEETKRHLEGEKKALASELAGKTAEDARLRANLQEAGGTMEKLNIQVLELKEELQNTNKHFKALQSEKEHLEGERQATLKLDSERSASLAAIEEIKGRLENEKKRLEDEKRSFGKEIEAKAAEEVRLLKKIQELEARYEQKEAEIKTSEAQRSEKYRLAIKTNEAQQAEKYRLALKANEAAMAQQAEKHRLAIKEYETKNRALEETKRNLEGEKKSLASDLTWKIMEETRLRASLQEAGGTIEKLNARVLELKDELQNTNKHLKISQSEKEQLEDERQVALKLSEKKSSVIAALENDKKLSKSEDQRLWAEKKSIEEDRRRLEGEKLRLENEKKRLEGERRNFGKELEARAAEEVRLLERIKGLDARYEQKEAEIKTNEMQQTEKQRLTIKEYEVKYHAVEEAKRNLEGEKKALASELAGKAAEEARLRASLEEAGGTTEKLNARILKLREDLQDADRNFKALQSEKEQLEGERQVALKLNEKKNAIIAALENDKKLLKIEEQRLWTEKKDLEEERKHLEGEELRLENERKNSESERRHFGKELEAKAAEEVRLLEKIQELDARYAQKEAEIRTNEAAVARQTEKRHLAIKAYEAKYQAAEEAKRHLEGEKKALASELAGKAAEEARLRVSLEEAGGTAEKLNARILKLKEELQNAIQHFKALQSEKEQVEGARQAALKLNDEKNAAIAALENDKKLSKTEDQRLLAEKKGLEEEKLRLQKVLEDRSVQANIQLERLTKRCIELENVISQTKDERDKKSSMAEDLTKTVKKMEILLRERETVQAALAGELKQEKEMRVKVQDHAKSLEKAFLALEKKINTIL
jgi:chromosome segregation ATPase